MDLFDEYPVLSNDLITLRKMTEDDADALKALTEEENVYKTIPTFLYELKYPDKREVIARMDEECFATELYVLLGVYLNSGEETGKMVGIAEIYNYDRHKKKASIGARISEAYWGCGVGSSVAVLLRDYLIRTLGLRTVTAHVLQENKGSEKTLIKAGYVKKYPDLWEDWGFDELKLTDKFAYTADMYEKAAGETADGKPEPVHVVQYVMAYEIEQDRIRALMPDGFESLRPVLRLNAEIRTRVSDEGKEIYFLEFNTPAEGLGRKGWLNIANWKSSYDDLICTRNETGSAVTFTAPFITLSFTGTGIEGGCPAETDNEGCFYLGSDVEFRPADAISGNKESCECEFSWNFHPGSAHGASEGKTIPVSSTPDAAEYEKKEMTAENAASIPCRRVLGAYKVVFTRHG